MNDTLYRRASFTTAICGLLLSVFAAISWTAINSKGATYDEPYHALSAWLQLRYGDFRMDNEDPPLWQYWASLPNGKSALSADFKTTFWTKMPQKVVYQWYWGVTTLYRTAGNDPVGFIHRCRFMMLILAVGLGACIARWAWQIGGAVAAVAATFFFALDPNFIAHASLMKNDVVFSLSMFLLAHALWRGGRKLTTGVIAQIVVLCIVTLTVKFSGLVAVTLVPVLLGTRALLKQPWLVFGRLRGSRFERLRIAAGVVALAIIVSFAGIWAVYGFRFRPMPERNVWLNMDDLAREANQNQFVARHLALPPPGAAMQTDSGVVIGSVLFANRHGLLPQPFLAGFLFTYANSLVRPAFLNGQSSMVGWWWYFPFAMLVKTPISTMLAVGVTIVVGVRSWRTSADADSELRQESASSEASAWTALCLILPFVAFMTSVMRSNFNIGLRHVLPVYPFAFVAIGWAISIIWQKRNRLSRGIVVCLIAMLATESLTSYPDFIPFFNVIAADTGDGKIDLLSDSNLDWGQDLPLLANWQKANPNIPLYLSYFGYEDPAFYKIRYTPLPGGYHYDPKPKFPQPFERCVLAISATNLQGELEPPELRTFYSKCRQLKLRGILGGTIYLFDDDPSQSFRLTAP